MKKIILLIGIGAGFFCDLVSANSTNQKRHSKEQIGKAVVYGLSGIAFSALAAVKGYDAYKMAKLIHDEHYDFEIKFRENDGTAYLTFPPIEHSYPLIKTAAGKEFLVVSGCLIAAIYSFGRLIHTLRSRTSSSSVSRLN